MSNIIRVSELSPNSEWLVMSNHGTDFLNNECDIMKEIREPDKEAVYNGGTNKTK